MVKQLVRKRMLQTLEQPGVKAPGTAKRTPFFPLKSWSIETLFPGSPSWTSTAGRGSPTWVVIEKTKTAHSCQAFIQFSSQSNTLKLKNKTINHAHIIFFGDISPSHQEASSVLTSGIHWCAHLLNVIVSGPLHFERGVDLPDHHVLLGVKDCETFWEKSKLLPSHFSCKTFLRERLCTSLTALFYKTSLCVNLFWSIEWFLSVILLCIGVRFSEWPLEGDKSLRNSSVVSAIKMANVPIQDQRHVLIARSTILDAKIKFDGPIFSFSSFGIFLGRVVHSGGGGNSEMIQRKS